MRLNEIEIRLSAINTEIDAEGADLDALEIEINELKEERKAIISKTEKRKTLINDVAKMTDATVIRKFDDVEERKNMDKIVGTESKEYRSAFFKRLNDDQLTEIEQRAFTHTTGNTNIALPVETVRNIWSLIGEKHPIIGDITLYRTGTVLELTKHTAIVDGDANTVLENVANTDEQNTFVKVTLSGKDFSKHVEISYALGKMSAGSLEEYLIGEIADRLGAALAKDVVTEITGGLAAGNSITTAGVKVIKFKELASAFGLLKNTGSLNVYTNNATFYNYLVSMEDTAGRPIYQPNAQNGAMGALIGANVKIEDAVADNVILIGDSKQIVGNMIQDIMIEMDKDIKRHVYIYSGYARFECELMNDKGFVKITVKQV